MVPPDALTLALPLHKPLQVTFVTEVLAVNADGCVIDDACVVVHPFPSVMVTVKLPMHKLLMVLDVITPLLQLYE